MINTHFARLAFPNEVGLSSATTHFIFLLSKYQHRSKGAHLNQNTHKSVHTDPVWVDLTARCALDLESVPERSLFCIIWTKIRYTDTISYASEKLERETYPERSAVRARTCILTTTFRVCCCEVPYVWMAG